MGSARQPNGKVSSPLACHTAHAMGAESKCAAVGDFTLRPERAGHNRPFFPADLRPNSARAQAVHCENNGNSHVCLSWRSPAYAVDGTEAVPIFRVDYRAMPLASIQGATQLESRFLLEAIAALLAKGNAVELVAPLSAMMGYVGAIVRHPSGLFEGATDPRSDGAAVAA